MVECVEIPSASTKNRIFPLACWNPWFKAAAFPLFVWAIARTWKDQSGQPILDGTNNADERAIGWWVKERYRTLRGYKREQSALNVSRLIAYCGNHLSDGLNLASIVA
jgi:hypothetical protein